jgi:hypothetical protein
MIYHVYPWIHRWIYVVYTCLYHVYPLRWIYMVYTWIYHVYRMYIGQDGHVYPMYIPKIGVPDVRQSWAETDTAAYISCNAHPELYQYLVYMGLF